MQHSPIEAGRCSLSSGLFDRLHRDRVRGKRAGLCAVLAKMGKKVVVLEQHYTAGGFTHCFEHGGYEFGTGLHYVGDLRKESIIRRVFDFISSGELRWRDMGAVYDQYRIGKKTYDVVAGKAGFVQEFVKNFPSESAAVDLYLKKVKRVGR